MLDRRVLSRVERPHGVTLIELLVVLAIAAVLLAVGVPNLRSYFVTNGLATTTNEFHSALNLARSEARKRGVSVTLRRNGTTSQRWSDGWAMFVDINSNGTQDTGDDPIQQHGQVGANLSIYANSAASDKVTFDAQGRATGGGVFVICYDGALQAGGESRSRVLMVSSSGRVRAGVDSNGDKIPETDSGAVDSCTNPSNAS
jgi:type IV fimbrial biogenesis protein FimT